eukprot:SAG11_NODE_1816_length_4215_cov_2.783042_2_plen_30_part_00
MEIEPELGGAGALSRMEAPAEADLGPDQS